MKKTTLLFALVLVCAAFSSCLINIRWTFRENLSDLRKAESSTVVFDGVKTATFIVKEWNDNDINKALYGIGLIDKNDRAELIVPPGDNSFIFDVFFDYGPGTVEKRNIELQYRLEAGKKYIVKPRINTTKSGIRVSKREFFIGIYPDGRRSEPLKEWKLGEIVY